MESALAVERSIWVAVSPERAWQAVTQAQQLEKWYAPTFAWEIPALEVGARVTFYNSPTDILHATIEILDPPHRFQLRWEGDPELVTTFTVIAENGGARVTIHETGYGAGDQAAADQVGEGYGMSMANLKAYLEGRQIPFTGDDHSVYPVQRSAVIAVVRERVWRAITEPEQISQWFDGSMKWDFRLAAGETIRLSVNGEHIGDATIAVVEPPERFAFRWMPEPGNPAESLVTFLLETVSEGTRVTVTEAGFEALPDNVRQRRRDMNAQGWGIALDNLSAYLRDGRDS
jgi:uncharacterized protein YndB with AHSA1/START domain